ncbi:uncharacterized protein LOC109837019 [Asparagus officinalis]|uniref:uncharacterized protein LOC109837019 n=1 Tax=Asparagus officinalis TaxID=4686 RepID=UPI00098DED67|nr:uncharacterized protein LOC109837019 [Asparagus officinalis]
MVVMKKNGKIQIYIDFRDLNLTCSKDEFPLPIKDVMVDNKCGFKRILFMDGFSGYNQIKMHPDNYKHTAFRTPLGVFCYTVSKIGDTALAIRYDIHTTESSMLVLVVSMIRNYIRDKDWMYAGRAEHMQSIFVNGVSVFMDFVRRHDIVRYVRLICPCKLCVNKLHQLEEEVELHIMKNGFVRDYKTWVYHGEIEGFSDADEEE